MIYQFEDFSLDVGRQELRHGADRIDVEPQVLDLLQYIIRNRERVVSKDDLIEHVWHGRIVSDSTLTSRIGSMSASTRMGGLISTCQKGSAARQFRK